MLHIKSKGITKCSTMVADILPPPLTLGAKRSKINFPEQCHDAYKFKGITNAATRLQYLACSPSAPHDPRRWDKKVKLNFFQNIVMLHIRLKGITNAATRLQISCLQTLPHDPRRWDQKVKLKLFQNIVMLHIKLKGITNAATW